MEIAQQMLSVLAVLGLLMGALWWLRRRGVAHMSWRPGSRPAAFMQVLERQPLAHGHSLHLVRLADRAILVAVWPAGCAALETLDWKTLEQSRQADDAGHGRNLAS